MANFLNLLRAWGESLFTAKKSWIGEQSLPTISGSVQTFNNQTGSVVSPVSGWARVQAQCDMLQASFGDCLITVANQNNNWPSVILPVKKGATLYYDVPEGFNGTVSIWFSPNQSSQ